VYCRQKVSGELQRLLSVTRGRSSDCQLASATLRKEQTVSMTRAVLGKVAGGPLLAGKRRGKSVGHTTDFNISSNVLARSLIDVFEACALPSSCPFA
jgi:hypothetical protein